MRIKTTAAALARYRPLRTGILVQAPLVSVAFYLWLIAAKTHWRMQDFAAVRSAGHMVLHGISPYPPADPVVVAHAEQLVYPPLVAYLFAPLLALPYGVAAPTYAVLALASIALALRVLGVTDWRCYTVVGLWYPLASALGFGTLGPPLVLLVALAWRYRDRRIIAPGLLAVAVVAKLFLWPVAVWHAATRPWRASALTVALTIAAFFAPFLPLGFGTLVRYPKLLRVLDAVFGPTSLASNAFLRDLGAPRALSDLLVGCLGVVLVLTIIALGRRGRDSAALSVAIAAALFLSPIVWVHYYVFLIVPLALGRPRLSPAWFLPILFWAEPERQSDLWHAGVGIGVTILVLVCSVPGDRFARSASRGHRTVGIAPGL